MADADNNPIHNLEQNGRRVRHCLQTAETRTIKTDREAEHALALAKRLLAGDVKADRPSVSLVMRRSLALYGRHLEKLAANPQDVYAEKLAVRSRSCLPSLKKHLPIAPRPLQPPKPSNNSQIIESWETTHQSKNHKKHPQ